MGVDMHGMLLAIAIASASATVLLIPGDNLQSIVDAHPAGTTYTFAPGLYRFAAIAPKTGDTYSGAGGGLDPSTSTILTGARVLTSFGRDPATGLYVAVNQTQHGQIHGECLPGHPRCKYPARPDSAEHFFRSNALHCTVTARILILA